MSNEKQYNKRIDRPTGGATRFFNQKERVDGKEIRETGTGDSVSASRMLIAQVLILNH